MDRILKLTMYVAGIAHRDEFVRVADELLPPLFTAGAPANTLVVVESLASPDLLVEIEAIAHV